MNRARVSFIEHAARDFAVGDCVIVPPSETSPTVVRAQRSSCAVDPSYTIGATTAASGSCPSAEYQRFPGADEPTAALCLVPNLIADHCYQLQMPVGVVTRADCASTPDGPDIGVLVQVTQRLDVRDQAACPTANGHYAWPYPAPARTYCTQTLIPKLVG